MPFHRDDNDTRYGNALAWQDYIANQSRFEEATILPKPVADCVKCGGTGEYRVDGRLWICECVRQQQVKQWALTLHGVSWHSSSATFWVLPSRLFMATEMTRKINDSRSNDQR